MAIYWYFQLLPQNSTLCSINIVLVCGNPVLFLWRAICSHLLHMEGYTIFDLSPENWVVSSVTTDVDSEFSTALSKELAMETFTFNNIQE